MHAHTGVMSHLPAPADLRMVARDRVGAPAQSSAACKRRRGAAASASVERKEMEGGDQDH